jgi:Flavin containing amine oxidoreductase/HMG (high mobility group) box
MAGDAALQAEDESDGKLVAEMTSILARIHHKQTLPPPPTQYIVTRWNSDEYARGSYSYVGAESSGKDYDILSQSVDRKVFFAGEATCRTHPATVHGAYLSGLRAASEVLETFIGKIDLPSGDVLIPKKNHPFRNPLVEESRITHVPKRTDPKSSRYKARNVRRDRFSKIAEECSDRILAQIGPKPIAPKKYLPNAFLLFQKDRWEEARKKANQAKSLAASETPDLESRDELRASMGRLWKNLPEEEKKRYNDAIEKEKTQYREEMSTFDARVEAWESGAEKIKEEMKAKLDEIELTEEEKSLVRAAEEEEKLEILAREERAKLRKFYEDVGIDDILPDEDDEVSEVRNYDKYGANPCSRICI